MILSQYKIETLAWLPARFDDSLGGDETRSYAGKDGSPRSSLLTPVEDSGDGLQLGEPNRVAESFAGEQEQNLLLNIRSQQEQVHDLSDASPADVAQLRQLAVVDNPSGSNEALHADGECHEAGNSGNVARRGRDGPAFLSTLR